MGAQGTTTVDFGAFPGKYDTSVAVTGQAAIVAGSLVEAWVRPVDTADHKADEHMLEPIKVIAGNIVAGTGFTIYAFNTTEIFERWPSEAAEQSPSSVDAAGAGPGTVGYYVGRIGGGGRGPVGTVASNGRGTPDNRRRVPRLYGLFTVAWCWN